MKWRNPLKLFVFLSLFLVQLLSSWALAQYAPRVLNVGSGELPDNYNHLFAEGSWNSFLLDNIVEGLVTLDAKGRVKAGLASHWYQSLDRQRMAFVLRKNAKWSDGSPIVAEDFVLAWQLLVSEAAPKAFLLRSLNNYDSVRSGRLPKEALGVRAMSARTVEVHLQDPVPFFLELLAYSPLAPIPSHKLRSESVKQHWQDLKDIPSSGPFTVVAVRDEQIALKRNPHYYSRQSIFFDQVVVHGYEGQEALNIRDFLLDKLDFSELKCLGHLKWAKENHPEFVQNVLSPELWYLLVNADSALFSERLLLRQALSMAIDREELIAALSQEALTADPAYTVSLPSMFDTHAPQAPAWLAWPMQKRLSHARALVAKVLQQTGGDELMIDLRVSEPLVRVNAAQMIRNAWRKIGVRAQISISSVQRHSQQLAEGIYDVALVVRGAEYHDPHSLLHLFGSQGATAKGQAALTEFDDLLAKAVQMRDGAERERVYGAIEALNHEVVAAMPLLFRKRTHLAKPELQGIRHSSALSSPYRWRFWRHSVERPWVVKGPQQLRRRAL